MLRRLVLAVLAATLTVSVAACDGDASSGASSAPSADPAPASSGATSAAPSAAPSAASDPKSQALCATVTNATARGRWDLGDPVAESREVAGVPVPGCQVNGDGSTSLTVAFLPASGGMAGADLLSGLCQAVVGAASADGRSCTAPEQRKVGPGDEVRRVDLMDGDGGVIVSSFTTGRKAYAAHAVADLTALGRAMARDSLLARALG